MESSRVMAPDFERLARTLPDTAILATGPIHSAEFVIQVMRAGAMEYLRRAECLSFGHHACEGAVIHIGSRAESHRENGCLGEAVIRYRSHGRAGRE